MGQLQYSDRCEDIGNIVIDTSKPVFAFLDHQHDSVSLLHEQMTSCIIVRDIEPGKMSAADVAPEKPIRLQDVSLRFLGVPLLEEHSMELQVTDWSGNSSEFIDVLDEWAQNGLNQLTQVKAPALQEGRWTKDGKTL